MNSFQTTLAAFFALAILADFSMAGIVDSMIKFPCFQRKYQLKRFYCKNHFFLSFRESPFQSCSERAKEMLNCKKAINKECLVLADKSDFFYQIYSKTASKPDSKRLIKEYCHNAGLLTPFVDPKSMKRIGCSVDFYIGKSTCIRDFQRKWRHNRSSKLLCKEYHNMEKCIDHAVNSHCTKKAVSSLKIHKQSVLSKLTSSRNPFCKNSREQF